jgi:tetratricopeptide (TPR) repeat protein
MHRTAIALSFLAVHPSLTLAQAPLTRAELVEQTRELVRQRAENDTFSGAVLLAQGDEVLLTLAAGEADKGFHIKNDVDTLFNLGSLLRQRSRASEAVPYLERFLREAPKALYSKDIARVQAWLGR